MTVDSRAPLADRSLALRLRVDRVCEEFEASWQAGRQPRIEDHLDAESDDVRPVLLRELVALEIIYRRKNGEGVARAEYRARFPGNASLVDSVFDSLDQSNPLHPTITLVPDKETLGADPLIRSALDAGSAPSATLPQVAGYEIESVLGWGGMGIVYKARQRELGRTVALKMILAGPHARPDELERFRSEAAAVAQLQHPNIVQIYEVGEQDGLPYFSLEYIDGGNLAQELRMGPLPALSAAELVETLARAMHVAHQRGIVHRDLKPANILLHAADCILQAPKHSPTGKLQPAVPKITDFGLAKRLDSDGRATRSGVPIGTPSYMAPEQAGGKSKLIGPAADVYALGAILYHTLTGQPPFKGPTPLDTVLLVLHREPTPPRQLQPRVPRDLGIICLKCLEKGIGKRYTSAEALADDLRRFRKREPILARPTHFWERAAKWTRRRPAAAMLVVVLVLAVLGSIGQAAWYAIDLQSKYSQARFDAADAHRKVQQAERRAALASLQAEVRSLEEQGRKALADKDWQNARVLLSSALAKIDSESADESLLSRVADLQQELDALAAGRTRYEQFRANRDKALFHETLFTGLDAASSRRETLAAATEALRRYSVTAGSPGHRLMSDPHLTDAEQAEVDEGCYELLLVIAELTARPGQGQLPRARPSRRCTSWMV
jgi:eukaryotic-like serine/threonine-protein kinase